MGGDEGAGLLGVEDLTAAVASRGLTFTPRQLRRWSDLGLLPEPASDPDDGGRSGYPPETAARLGRLLELRASVESTELIRILLWAEGFALELGPVRIALRESLEAIAGELASAGGDGPHLIEVVDEASDEDLDQARRVLSATAGWWRLMLSLAGERDAKGSPLAELDPELWSAVPPDLLPVLLAETLAGLRHPAPPTAQDASQPAGPGARPARGEARQAIVEAGVRVVARLGFDGLTYREVARQAGITHGAVGYHFRTREELIQEVVMEARRIAVAGASIVPPEGRLDRFGLELARSSEDDLDAHLSQYELALQARRRPELAQVVQNLYEDYFEITGQALREMGLEEPDDDLARLVFAAIDGLVIQQVVNDDSVATDEAVGELQRLLAAMGANDGD